MKILAISDIHCRFNLFSPENMGLKHECPDLILIAGDITNYGIRSMYGEEIENARIWLLQLAEYAPVYFVTGNHDIGMVDCEIGGGKIKNITDKTIEFNGFKIVGMNMTTCYSIPRLAQVWERMTANKKAEEAYYSQFQYADIVLSHSPAYGYLDKSFTGEKIGSKELSKYLKKYKPKHLFHGHVHECRGLEATYLDTKIYNVATIYKYITV
jgi:Icc-related predicted phosphoesterase